MHRYNLLALTVALGTALTVFAQAPQTPQSPQTQNRRASSAGMRSSDETFLKKAADGNMAEVQLGQLAQKNASSDSVKQFGQRMVTDHSKMLDDIKNLAASKGVTLPSSPATKIKAAYNRLASKAGAEFDKDYITTMVKDHNEDIAEFRKEAESGMDPDVKALASQALPILQEHLRMAQDCAKQLGISVSGGSPGNL